MATFAQDTFNDISVVNGQWVLLTDNADQVRQVLQNRLQFFEGEWFLDTRLGVPYFQFVYVKNPDLNVVDRVFRRAILSVPGLTQILELTLTPNAAARTLAVFTRVQTDEGAIIAGGTGEPFIVEVR